MKFLVVIEPEKMTYRNDVPANALLKTLEEPPGRSVFLLLSHDAHLLLPTIVSRCVNVNFPKLRAAEIATILAAAGATPEDAAAAAARADGTLEGAARVLSAEYAAALDDALAALEQLKAEGVRGAFAVASNFRDRQEALKLVAALADLNREAALTAAGAAELGLQPEYRARLARLAEGRGLKPPEATWEALATATAALHDNANVALTLEELLLRLARP